MGTERDDGQRPELQDQAVVPPSRWDDDDLTARLIGHDAIEPTDEPAPWENTSVVGRYPAGTDPRLALREVMTVFMERTDGTNALPWWQQAPLRWWHAGLGGLKRGDELLPPSQTGQIPSLLHSDRTAVYVTTDRAEAIMYAAQHVVGAFDQFGHRTGPLPRLYEVSFHEEPQPDDTQPDSTTSFRVPSATIRRVEVPSRAELSDAIGQIMAVHEAQLAARLVEAAEAEITDDGDSGEG